jgi:hypothetical protein
VMAKVKGPLTITVRARWTRGYRLLLWLIRKVVSQQLVILGNQPKGDDMPWRCPRCGTTAALVAKFLADNKDNAKRTRKI